MDPEDPSAKPLQPPGESKPNSTKQRNILIILSVVLIFNFLATVILAVTLGLTLGTTSCCSLKNTIINKCNMYLKDNGATSEDGCEKIWNSFTQAFVGRDPWKVPPESYDTLMQTVSEVSQKPTCNKMMFWSKTKGNVHKFAKKCSYVTVEDTLLGSLLDGLTWCGKSGSQEIFTTGCPSWPDCVNDPVGSFWKRASEAFAASACGDAFVMLNGTINESYNSTSIFASVEVKHFTPNMSSLTVLLVTTEGDTQTCESDASLKNLTKDLDPKLKYQCKVVPQSQLVQTCIVH